MLPCLCFCLSGDRHSLGSLAFKTARPADESWKSGDHRISGAGVRMYQRSGLQVQEHSEMHTHSCIIHQTLINCIDAKLFPHNKSQFLISSSDEFRESQKFLLAAVMWRRPAILCCENKLWKSSITIEKMDDVFDLVLISYIRKTRLISLFTLPSSVSYSSHSLRNWDASQTFRGKKNIVTDV